MRSLIGFRGLWVLCFSAAILVGRSIAGNGSSGVMVTTEPPPRGSNSCQEHCELGYLTVDLFYECSVSGSHCDDIPLGPITLVLGDGSIQWSLVSVTHDGNGSASEGSYSPGPGDASVTVTRTYWTSICIVSASTQVFVTNDQPTAEPITHDTIMATHMGIHEFLVSDTDWCDFWNFTVDSIRFAPEFPGYSSTSNLTDSTVDHYIAPNLKAAVKAPITYAYTMYINDGADYQNSTNTATDSVVITPCPKLEVSGWCDTQETYVGGFLYLPPPSLYIPPICGYDPPQFFLAGITPQPAGELTVNAGNGLITFSPVAADADPGDTHYAMTLGVHGGGDTTFYSTDILVRKIQPYQLAIEEHFDVFPEFIFDLEIYSFGGFGGPGIGEFNLLLEYNADLLNFFGAVMGGSLIQAGWEYFAVDTAFETSTKGIGTVGLIRLHGIADIENGSAHPSDTSVFNSEYSCVAQLYFIVDCDTSGFDSTFYFDINPVNWAWRECTDNSLLDFAGDRRFTSGRVYDAVGASRKQDNLAPFPQMCDRIEITDSSSTFPTSSGLPTGCSFAETAIRRVDFKHGGFSAVHPDSVDGEYPVADDYDCDGIPTRLGDNCPHFFNPNQLDSDADGVGDACTFVFATPAGTNIQALLGPDVTLTFHTVQTSGETRMTQSGSGPALPKSFLTLPAGTPAMYVVTSAAIYADSVDICIVYDPNGLTREQESSLELIRFTGAEWSAIASTLDTAQDVICGTSASLSSFAVTLQYSCCLVRGDANHSSAIDVADLTFLVSYLFRGGDAPPCEEEGDTNSSGDINVADLTFLVAYIFQGGSTPAACF